VLLNVLSTIQPAVQVVIPHHVFCKVVIKRGFGCQAIKNSCRKDRIAVFGFLAFLTVECMVSGELTVGIEEVVQMISVFIVTHDVLRCRKGILMQMKQQQTG
jgi:hypothetical protein